MRLTLIIAVTALLTACPSPPKPTPRAAQERISPDSPDSLDSLDSPASPVPELRVTLLPPVTASRRAGSPAKATRAVRQETRARRSSTPPGTP